MANTESSAGFSFVALAAAGAIAVLARAAAVSQQPRPNTTREDVSTKSSCTEINRASSLLAGAVLADSAVEHYRGSFHNTAMYLPLAISAQALVAGVQGMIDRNGGADVRRVASHQLAVINGTAGLGALDLIGREE